MGCHALLQGIFSTQELNPCRLHLPALAGVFFATSATWEVLHSHQVQFSSVAQLCLTLLTPWTVAHQAPLSKGFFRQEYWSGLPCPPPGELPKPGIKPRYPSLQVDFYHLSRQGSPNKDEGAPICRMKEEEEGKMRKQSSTAALECTS